MRTLLVEDDDDIRTLVRLSLEQLAGWEVVEVASGAAALQVASAKVFDVVLLDVMMPGMDGPETMRHLRAMPNSADLPVVFLTAKAMPSEVQRLLALGAAGVITKPFDPGDLVERIAAILAGATGPEAAEPGSAGGPTGDDSEIDPRALRKLTGLEGDSGRDLRGELIDLFADNAPDSIQALRDACVGGDDTTATRVAHTLRSSAGTLGAVRLAALAGDLEAACASGGASESAEKIERVAVAIDEAVANMRRVREELERE